jgi:hypothetical protein
MPVLLFYPVFSVLFTIPTHPAIYPASQALIARLLAVGDENLLFDRP